MQTQSTPATDHPLSMLGLPARPYKCLRRHGIRTVEQLARLPDADILAIRALGDWSLRHIHAALERWPDRLRPGDLPPAPPTCPSPPL